MERCTAWMTPSDGEWTIDSLNDQFQKAITLSGISVDDLNSDDLPDSDGENHNDDMHYNSDKVSQPYKNKYSARIMLIEVKDALTAEFDKLTPEQKIEVCSYCILI